MNEDNNKGENKKDIYSEDFYLTKYTMPVVWQISSVMPGGFFIYHEDEKRELIYASKRVYDIYGCKNLDEFKQLTGYTFEGMVHPDDFERVQASIDEQIDADVDGKMDHVEYRIKRKDGSIRWVDDFGHFSHSPEYGDVYYVFIYDITEKKMLQKDEEKIDAIKEMAKSLINDINREIPNPEETLKNHIKMMQDLLQ